MKKLKTIIAVTFDIEIWKEGDTWIFYSKLYDISSYGKTQHRAGLMFERQIAEILLHTKPKKK